MSHHLDAPLGFRTDGRPFWLFFGSAPEDGDGGAGDGDNGDGDGDTGGDNDGDGKPPVEADPVKKATAPLLSDLKRVRGEYRPIKQVLNDLGISTPEQLREALTGKSNGKPGKGDSGGEQVDVEKIRTEAKAEATREANRRVALSKIEARSTGKFADPEDAVNALTGEVDDFINADGTIDVKGIDSELERLLTRKPHFGIPTEGTLNFDGGARRTATAPAKMDDFLRNDSRRKRGQ